MSTQTGSISFEATGGFNSYAKQNYATLSQIKGQFATCGTSANTAEKIATIVPADSGWTLYEGATVTVKFTNKNTSATPTLNVNGTGAKPIKDFNGNDLTQAAREWPEGAAIALTYDGTSWRVQDSNLMERVHTAETGIEQNSKDIKLKANTSDVYNKDDVDGLISQEVIDRNAAIELSAEGITQTVSETYATKGEISTIANPNLHPFFSQKPYTLGEYWAIRSLTNFATPLEDGWAHIEYENTDTSNVYMNVYVKADTSLKLGTTYTLLTEFRNIEKNGTVTYNPMSSPNQFASWQVLGSMDDGEVRCIGITKNSYEDLAYMTRTFSTFTPGSSISCDMRISLYEGDYKGPYKRYVDPSLMERISTAETIIEQNSTQIALKANSSEVYTKDQTNDIINSLELLDDRYFAPWNREISVLEFGYLGEDKWKSTNQYEDFSKDFCVRVDFIRNSEYQTQRYCLASSYDVPNPDSGLVYPQFGIELKADTNNIRLYSQSDTKQITDKVIDYVPTADVWTTIIVFWHSESSTFEWLAYDEEHYDYGTYKPTGTYTGVSGEVWIGADHRTNNTWNCAYSQRDMPALWYPEAQSGDYVCFWDLFKSQNGESTGATKVACMAMAGAIETQVNAAKSEIKITTDGISSEVSKISSVKYVTSSTSSWTLSGIKTYAAEGHSEGWNVVSTENLRVGDTVYVKGTDSTRNCPVYIKVTVTGISSETRFTGISHGYEDVLPVDTIKSTINQSSDTVKIQAKHIEIDGTATFKNSDNTTTTLGDYLNNNYDEKGAAAIVQENLDNLEIGGRNLLIGDAGKPGKWIVAAPSGASFIKTESNNGYYVNISFNTVSGYENLNSPAITVENGAEYTLSCKYKVGKDFIEASGKGGYGLTIRTDSGNHSGYDYASNSLGKCKFNTTAGTYSSKFTFTSTTDTIYLCLNGGQLSDNQTEMSFDIYDIKLEKGNKATDWAPAPEDTQASIETISDYADSIRTWYAICPTAESTAAKVATINPVTSDFTTSILTPGTVVFVRFSITNKAAVADLTLNINNTGAKPIKQVRNGTVQNLPGVGYIAANATYQFTYDGTNWLYTGNYDSNTNDNARYVQYYNSILTGEALAAASIIGGHADGKFYQVKENASFDLSSPLLWLTTALKENATDYSHIYTQTYDRNLATFYTSFVATTDNQNKIVYLVGTVNGNTFSTYGTDSAQYLTCMPPTTENGLVYIPIGRLGNQSNGKNYFNYQVGVPVTLYAYIDGKFRQVTPTEIVATHRVYYRTTVANSNLAAPTAWVDEATANAYNVWTTKIPPLASGTNSSVTGYTKYPYLYTCEQRKRLDGTIECTKVLLDESTTIIDGGNIITNSITANQIAADAITADKINVDNLAAINSNLGTLTAGTIDASKVTVKNIDATKITVNKIQGSQINVSSINIGDLAGEIGGRNLLQKSIIAEYQSHGTLNTTNYIQSGTITYTRDTAQNYGFYISNYSLMEPNTEYVISFKAKVTSGSITQIHIYSTNPNNIVSSNIYMNGTNLGSFNTNLNISMSSSYSDFILKFKTASTLSTGSYTGQIIQWNKGVSTAFGVEMINLEWEKGSKPTDWTPAPEDIDSAVEDAAATATNYISANSSGIRIASADPATQKQRIQLTNGRIDFYNANDVSVGAISGNVARFGLLSSSYINIDGSNGIDLYDTASKKRVTVNTSGLHVYDTDGTTETGLFGAATARIGKTNSSRFLMNADSLQAYNSSNTKYFEVNANGMTYGTNTVATTTQVDNAAKTATNYMSYNSTDGLRIASASPASQNQRVQLNSTSLKMFSSDGLQRLSLDSSNGVTVGRTDKGHVSITDNGMTIYDNSGADIGSFATTTADSETTYVRVGPSTGSRTLVKSTGIEIFKDTTSIASFGDTVRIGKPYIQNATNNTSHIELDYHSLQLIDKEGQPYFYVSDLRDETGYGPVTDIFAGDGHTETFDLTGYPDMESLEAVVSDNSGGSFSFTGSTLSPSLRFSEAPTDGATITITYRSSIQQLKAYTLGTREKDSSIGVYSYSEGYLNTAQGNYSHAEGANTHANGKYSHAEGYNTFATGPNAVHVEGYDNIANGDSSHAEGRNTIANGDCSHAEGWRTVANGAYSHAEGANTIADNDYSHAEGWNTITIGRFSHAEGYNTKTGGWGLYAHVEGDATFANHMCAHAEGSHTIANGGNSHAEGSSTIASGGDAHAEGWRTIANGGSSHAEGSNTIASGSEAHAEGDKTTASGSYSHAEGTNTIANGYCSHAEGRNTIANGQYSHAGGYYTTADQNYMTAIGTYNRTGVSDVKLAVGNGSSDTYRKNAFTVISSNGGTATAYFNGTTSGNGTTITSDERVKTLIKLIDSKEAINFIKSLKPKLYYKEESNEYGELGFYAQEVEQTIYGKQLVTKDNSGMYDIPDFRVMSYEGFIAPTVAALQAALEKIEKLEAKVEALENK